MPNDPSIGHVGGPVTTVEYKIIDFPDMGYYSNNINEQGKPEPKGEILVRGANVATRYFNCPDTIVDEEGWLATGDIGVRLADNGALKIIDRKANFIKMQGGEFVALEAVETVLRQSAYVQQIMVDGNL